MAGGFLIRAQGKATAVFEVILEVADLAAA
jgi:hypothetical protein